MDTWEDGDGYEPFIGRWSRPVASEFLDWLSVNEDRQWLDVGCGTGALLSSVMATHEPGAVAGVDTSAGFLATAAGHLGPTADLRVADAQRLPFDDGSFDVVVSGLVLNFVPDPAGALGEMRRVARPGATVGVYVWDYAGKMELLRRFWEAAVALDPLAESLDEAARFPICRPDSLNDLFLDAGLRDVETRSIDVPTVFSDFDDYWNPFLLAQGPAPSYVASLSDTDTKQLEQHIRLSMDERSDGSIDLIARAWAARGTA